MIYKHTDKILVQSPKFIDYIKKQNVKKNKLFYYPYYAEDFYKVVKVKKIYKEKFPPGSIFFLLEILVKLKVLIR